MTSFERFVLLFSHFGHNSFFCHQLLCEPLVVSGILGNSSSFPCSNDSFLKGNRMFPLLPSYCLNLPFCSLSSACLLCSHFFDTFSSLHFSCPFFTLCFG